jgi:F0F1-type ATP synthase assembly protein I
MAAKNRKLLGRYTREFQANASRSGEAASAGYGLIGAICLLGGLGFFADRWLNTAPWLLVIGLLLGVVVGFYELSKMIWRR